MNRFLSRGRRGRRLRRLIGLLGVALCLTLVFGYLAYSRHRTRVRRPGEALADITQKLALELPQNAPAPDFVDVTTHAGLGDFRAFNGDRTSQLPEDMGSGLAWGDYDNDGDDDLFVVGAGGPLNEEATTWAPSVLYNNQGDGRFVRVRNFPDLRIAGMAAAWGDYDGDGRLDLVVTGYRTVRLFHNDGEAGFSSGPELPAPPGYWAGATWGDYDGDGDLDLYVCGYVQYIPQAGGAREATQQFDIAVPYTLNPASYEPARNLLLRNDGAGKFVQVGESLGVDDPSGRSLSALWIDLDQNGRLDLYVANDISDNALYLNTTKGFVDAGLITGVADYRGAMGLAAGDWNRDGDDDLFITHWVAQENALYDSKLVDLASPGRAGPPDGPRGEDGGTRLLFSDLASPLGLGQIALQSVGWGTDFVDLDSDGWLDLVVANGSTLETSDTPRRLQPQAPMLLWNDHGKGFHDLAPFSPLLSARHVSRGLATSDFDGDGDVDVAIVNLDGGVQLLRNDMAQGHWLEIDLHNRLPDRLERFGRGDGSTVVVRAGGIILRRTVTSASYLSQSSATLHFGLGALTAIDSLEVDWLGGDAQHFGPLGVNARWALTQGDPTPRRVLAQEKRSNGRQARAQTQEFWRLQRAAMDAMKREHDPAHAVALLRQALAIDPDHLDARYYLANALAALGRFDEALDQLQILRTRDPESHRAHKQWGVLRAMTARSDTDLEAARQALERAHEINPEETGSLLVLGQIALLRHRDDTAEQQLTWACRTNPKAVGGFFLRGYLAWKQGDTEAAERRLAEARAALGEDWKPKGAAAEGDVAQRMHSETSPLSVYWEEWDGTPRPAEAYRALDRFLRSGRYPGSQL